MVIERVSQFVSVISIYMPSATVLGKHAAVLKKADELPSWQAFPHQSFSELFPAWSNSPTLLNTAAGVSQAVLVKASLFFICCFHYKLDTLCHTAVPSTNDGNKNLARNSMHCVVAGKNLLFPTSLALSGACCHEIVELN